MCRASDTMSRVTPGTWSRRGETRRRLAGAHLAARGRLGRGGDQLRDPRAGGDADVGLPLRRRRRRDAPRAHRGLARHLARRDPGRGTRDALRLPRRRPVAARAGAALQPARSCCSTPTRGRSAGGWSNDPAIFGFDAGGAGHPRPPRQRAVRPEERGGPRPRLRLGRRPAALHPLARHRDLRAAREGDDRAARPGARAPARHVRRAGDAGGDRLPARPRRDRGRAAAGAAVRERAAR